jgi:outer membrane protein assembly factor BamB
VRAVPTVSPWTSWFRRCSVALLACVNAIPAIPASAQSDPDSSWPMAGGDARHSGSADGPAPPYSTAWTSRLDGQGPLEGPVVSGDVVVVLGSEAVMGLDAASGEIRWEGERQSGPVGPPAVAGDLVIHATGRDAGTALVARGLDDGREEWRMFAGQSIPGGVTVEGGRAYAATRNGTLLAVDAATGEEEWRFRAAGAVGTTVAVLEGLVHVTAQSRSTGISTLHAVDAESGREEWRFSPPQTQPSVGTSPTAGGGVVYAGLSDGAVHALEIRTGVERWSERPLPPVTALGAFVPSGIPAAAEDGTVYVPGVARLTRLDPSGDELWSYQLPDLLGMSPSLSGPYALLGDASGLGAAVDVRSGRLVWRRQLGPGPVGSFAVTPDRLFVTTGREDGQVTALEHDPDGTLLEEESPTVLDPIRAALNYVGAAVVLGVLLLLLFRGPELLRRRSKDEEVG